MKQLHSIPLWSICLVQIWSTSVLRRLYNIELIFVSTPVNPTGFFVFSPTNYPQKPPCGVSGKLSSTPKPCKTAQLLRFFGKHLCYPRNLTQHVTYYKSKRVYYNIPSSFFQAAIYTRRDSNCGIWKNITVTYFPLKLMLYKYNSWAAFYCFWQKNFDYRQSILDFCPN